MSGHTVKLEGHVARVTTRQLSDGTQAMSMSVATNRSWETRSGATVIETTWFRCTAFKKDALDIASKVSSGDYVQVEGRLMPDKRTGTPKVWKAPNGEYRANYELKINSWKILEKKKNEQET